TPMSLSHHSSLSSLFTLHSVHSLHSSLFTPIISYRPRAPVVTVVAQTSSTLYGRPESERSYRWPPRSGIPRAFPEEVKPAFSENWTLQVGACYNYSLLNLSLLHARVVARVGAVELI